jgi:nucleotide-binding universal stress UspA family protein
MQITVFSVKGFTGNALKSGLEERLRVKGVSFSMREEHLIDQFIREGLISVPAIKVDHRIFNHAEGRSVGETLDEVMTYIDHRSQMSILVPIDFTEESQHALAYARMIAAKLDLGLTLMHIHEQIYDPVSFGAADVYLLEEHEKELYKIRDEILERNIVDGYSWPVHVQLSTGEAASGLLESAAKGNFVCMVMSTKGSTDFFRRLFGTVSSKVGRKSHVPVIIVPPDTVVTFPQKAVVGLTADYLKNGTLDLLHAIGDQLKVELNFVHVTDNDSAYQGLKSEFLSKWMKKTHRPHDHAIYQARQGKHPVDEVLDSWGEDLNAEILIMVANQRNFPENLTHPSITQRVLRDPHIPVMVLHREG